MNAHELFLLGRTLMKIAEEAAESAGYGQVPVSVRCVAMDVYENPGSSVGEIAERTGLPQSHVSVTVGRMRERGSVFVEPDPADGRRRLVRLSPQVKQRAMDAPPAPIDAALRGALSGMDEGDVREIEALVQRLSDRLAPSILTRMRSRWKEVDEIETGDGRSEMADPILPGKKP